ncbi:hypothetical protein NMG60_11013971 [Bertholletia excelsa]
MAEKETEVGFEEGMLFLPTQVLDEACDAKEYLRIHQRLQQNGRRFNLPAEPLPPQYRSSLKPHNYRQRYQAKRAAGGPGMRAIFLDHSGRRPSGTGVFLPQGPGTDSHRQKPACSPVLLPSRVVEALNINVQELGLQVRSPRDTNGNESKGLDGNGKSKVSRKDKDGSGQCGVVSQSREANNSPEIFLPKEWTY